MVSNVGLPEEKVKKGKYEQMAIDKKIKSDQRELYDINEEISDLKKDNLGTGLSELRIIELQNQAYDLTLSIAEKKEKFLSSNDWTTIHTEQ
jgi:hypothetical protein